MMRKIMQWMVAATLTSSLFVWTSCSNDDNAVIPQAIDSTALQALTAQLAISPDSVARLNRGMEDAATDYTGMTDAEIFLSDYKEYEIGGHLLGFGSLVCKQVAEGVIGPSLREGVCYTSEELSRKQIVPRITEVLTGN